MPGHGGGAAAACVGAVFLKSLAYLPAPTAAIGPPAKAPSGAAPRLTHPADDSCALTATGASLRGPARGGGSRSRAGAGSTNPPRAQSPPAALPQRPRAARPPLQRFPPSGAVHLGFTSSWPAACRGAGITAAFLVPQLCLEVPILIPRLPPDPKGWERSSRMRRWPPACAAPHCIPLGVKDGARSLLPKTGFPWGKGKLWAAEGSREQGATGDGDRDRDRDAVPDHWAGLGAAPEQGASLPRGQLPRGIEQPLLVPGAPPQRCLRLCPALCPGPTGLLPLEPSLWLLSSWAPRRNFGVAVPGCCAHAGCLLGAQPLPHFARVMLAQGRSSPWARLQVLCTGPCREPGGCEQRGARGGKGQGPTTAEEAGRGVGVQQARSLRV